MSESRQDPSIFVLWAEANLRGSIRRAIRFFVKFLANNYPHNLPKELNKNFEEYYLLFDLLLQWSHLHHWNSSFTERFFSLQRIRCVPSSKDQLQSIDILKSLMQLCLVPYVWNKLERYYEKVKEKQDINYLMELNRSEQIFLEYFPNIQKLVQMTQTLTWLLYVTSGSRTVTEKSSKQHSIWFKILNLRLCHQSSQEVNFSTSSFTSNISFALASLFQKTFHFAAFTIQFIEYWNMNTDLRKMLFPPNEQHLNLPRPDFIDNSSSNNMISSSKFHCPICQQERHNPTALSSSGYVFCYSCIHDYIRKNHRCPVTGCPSELEQLVRIFES